VASAVGKPDGLLLVPPDGEEAFLHPLPVRRLWGVGAKTNERLHARGIETVGDIARLTEGALAAMLGPAAARHLHALANCRDPRRIETGRRRRSIGSQHAMRHTVSVTDIDNSLAAITDRVCRRMRKADRVGRTIVVRVRFGDFTRATRSHTLDQATAHTATILEVARRLLAAVMPLVEERGLTLIGLSIANLDDDDAVQLTLPFDKASGGALDDALDDLRGRFGASSITRATLLGRTPDLEMPMLPD
jgi:DNA polymerase-4